MKITFDARTCADWLSRSVFSVKVMFVKKGCEGTKVEVQEKFSTEGLMEFPVSENLSVFANQLDAELLDGAVLTHAKGKWIFTSSKVVKRCGCGSSFAFSGIPHPGKQQKGEFLNIPGHSSDSEKDEQDRKVSAPEKSNVSISEPVSVGYKSEDDLATASDSRDTSEILFENAGWFFSQYIQGNYVLPKGETIWYLCIDSSQPVSRIVLDKSNSHAQIRILVLGNSTERVDIQIVGEIQSDNSRLDIRVLTLVDTDEKAKVSITGSVTQGCKNYEIQVHQVNVFLDTTGSISGIPGLQVASNDGVAEHSAIFHSLQDASMQYLTARGLSIKQARGLLVNAQIADMFPNLDEEYRMRISRG